MGPSVVAAAAVRTITPTGLPAYFSIAASIAAFTAASLLLEVKTTLPLAI